MTSIRLTFFMRRAINYVRTHPQLWLAFVVFGAGSIATVDKISPLAGALFGSGAALVGAWINEVNRERALAEEKARLQLEARQHLAPELRRTIERAIFIYERATANFLQASAGQEITTKDTKADFMPQLPVLYPTSSRLRDLPGEDAVALAAFYDSLYAIQNYMEAWWRRKEQIAVNIFLGILNCSQCSLERAQICIESFDLDRGATSDGSSQGPLLDRIKRCRTFADGVMKHHHERASSPEKLNKMSAIKVPE